MKIYIIYNKTQKETARSTNLHRGDTTACNGHCTMFQVCVDVIAARRVHIL
jgi:hypothetical protein